MFPRTKYAHKIGNIGRVTRIPASRSPINGRGVKCTGRVYINIICITVFLVHFVYSETATGGEGGKLTERSASNPVIVCPRAETLK